MASTPPPDCYCSRVLARSTRRLFRRTITTWPRVSVLHKTPGSLNNTVVRAGVGIYYSPMPWVLELYPLALGTPSSVGIGFTNPQTTPIPVYQLGRNIFPPAPTGVITSTYAANIPPGTTGDGTRSGVQKRLHQPVEYFHRAPHKPQRFV
jgi:hypothetical protein